MTQPTQTEIDRKRQELLEHHIRTSRTPELAESIAESDNKSIINGRLRKMESAISQGIQRAFEGDFETLGAAVITQLIHYTDTGIVERALQDWIDDYPERARFTEEERKRDDNVFNVETQS